jgi:hypothetical protein
MNIDTASSFDPRQESGKIAGQVSTNRGDPLVDAVIMITGDSPPHSDIAALTNDDGRYSFIDLQPGQYTLMVNAEDWPSRTGMVLVEPGTVAQLDFTLTKRAD